MFSEYMNEPAFYGHLSPAIEFWRYPARLFFHEVIYGNPTVKSWVEEISEPKPMGTEILGADIHKYPLFDVYYWNHDLYGNDIDNKNRFAVIVPRSPQSGKLFSVGEHYAAQDFQVGFSDGQPILKRLSDRFISMTMHVPIGGPWYVRASTAHAQAQRVEHDSKVVVANPIKAKANPEETESDSDNAEAEAKPSPTKIPRL